MSVDTGLLLDHVHERTDAHNNRIDTKVSVLLALNFAAIGVAGAALTQSPAWAIAGVAAGTLAPLVASTLLALTVFAPNLSGMWGFMAYASAADPDEVISMVLEDHRQQATRLAGTSWAVRRKYRKLRVAVLLSGLGIAAGAAVGAVVGVSRLL
ncbi:hypothetical protein AB0B63_07225 [Micromonospora sp. NPDC049081]|uniref:hypothetical protein n=1 Tax=Micromonospora sp. NPDC049081 TaxID=3155150 RepID=UPI0033F64530